MPVFCVFFRSNTIVVNQMSFSVVQMNSCSFRTGDIMFLSQSFFETLLLNNKKRTIKLINEFLFDFAFIIVIICRLHSVYM